MKKRKYTQVTIEQVADLYYRGLNFSQIAVELNCARNTIRSKIREYAIKNMCKIYVGHGRPRKQRIEDASR